MVATLLPKDANGEVIPALKLGTVQTVSISSSSAATSSAVGADTRVIMVSSDVACNIAIAASPTASASTTYLPAGIVVFLAVEGGSSKVAAHHASNTGTLNVTELL